MYKSKVLVGFVLLCYLLFTVFEFSGDDILALYLDTLIVPSIIIFNLLFVKNRGIWYSLFLITYCFSEFSWVVIENLPVEKTYKLYDFEYYFGNSLFILAYTFLLIGISKSLCVFHVIRNFKIHIAVLTVLNIYLIYVLHAIINPNLVKQNDYYLELTYNIVVLLLLSIALLNYFYKDNTKSLYLFLGSLCIVFSEVMDIAYIYVTERSLLNFLSTTLNIIAFYFYYQQSKLADNINEDINMLAE